MGHGPGKTCLPNLKSGQLRDKVAQLQSKAVIYCGLYH